MVLLSDSAIGEQLGTLSGWTRVDQAIRKEFVFPSFPDAIAFAVRLAFEAEGADHHPDILVSYKRVTLTYSTHSDGGLTQKDFDGARLAERCVAR